MFIVSKFFIAWNLILLVPFHHLRVENHQKVLFVIVLYFTHIQLVIPYFNFHKQLTNLIGEFWYVALRKITSLQQKRWLSDSYVNKMPWRKWRKTIRFPKYIIKEKWFYNNDAIKLIL